MRKIISRIRPLRGSALIATIAFAGPVFADQAASAYRGPQPVQNAPQPQATQTPEQSRRVVGLSFDPDNRGSGPDKTKFNIVNEDEARRQQSQFHRGSGDSRTSDGTGGGENSSGH